jgi:hypothetical protein
VARYVSTKIGMTFTILAKQTVARVINARNHALLRFDASGGRSPSFLLPRRRSWMMSDRSRFHVRFRGSGESEMTAPLFRIARIS